MKKIKQTIINFFDRLFFNQDYDDHDITNERTERLSWRHTAKEKQRDS